MKKNLIILIIIVIVLVIILLLTKSIKNVPVEENILNQDSTVVSIEKELNSINVDVGIDQDIKPIDKELENL